MVGRYCCCCCWTPHILSNLSKLSCSTQRARYRTVSQSPGLPGPASPCRRPTQSPTLRRRDNTCGLMQQSIEDLQYKLKQCLDSSYNVIDMGTLLAVIAELAKTPITRDILERTRLGREIKYIRRQNQDPELNKRAKNLVREWRRIVEAEEGPPAASSSNGSNGHVQHSTAPATPVVLPGRPPPSGSGRESPDIEVLHNNSTPVPPVMVAAGSGGSRKRSAASHTLNKRYHHRNHTQSAYPPHSPATSRTAPASPALPRPSRGFSRHSAPSSPVCHSHNGSSHPSSPSDTPLHSNAPSSLSPASSRTTDVPVPVSSRPVETYSAVTSSRLGDASSCKHVANKRLRKHEPDDEVAEVLELDEDEPPSKRQRVAPMTNGSVVDVEDENSVGSSASSYCEVIEDNIVVEPLPANSAPPVWSSVQQPNRQSRASSNKDSLRYSSVSSNIKDVKSPSRRGRASSSRIGGMPGSVYQAPAASDASMLPGAPRGSSYSNSASKSPVGVEDCSDADTALVSNCIGGAAAHKSSTSRSGRGRGRRKSVNLRPSLPDLKLPSSSSKVKTTSQLVAELAQRKGDTLLAERASKLEEQLKSNDEMTRNKIDHVYRYVQSLPSPPDPHSSVVLVATPSPPALSVPTSPHPSDQPITISPDPEAQEGERQAALGEADPTQSVLDMLGVTGDEGEAELLNRLPPIDLEAAKETQLLEDRLDNLTYGHTEDGAQSFKNALEDDEATAPRPLSPLPAVAVAAVERLHSSQIPSVNGTLDNTSTFCEFHDVVQQQSYLDQPFNLLPYVVLDF
ncbi:Transcription factor IIS N-terminal [Trinorchestia longiramus]|nr:Transcription factor IIS N-terminal [Trinorchestia longiramus]